MQKVKRKETVTSYEAGSGMLYIPILGDLFPKLFNQKMRPIQKYHILTEKYRYEVRKETYEEISVGDVFDEKLSVFS